MDTFKTLLSNKIDGIQNQITIPEIPEEHVLLLKQYVCTAEFIQEIEQLYQVFLINVNALSSRCILNYDDTVYDCQTKSEANGLLVNALFINIISSGRILVDMIKTILKNDFSQNLYDGFKKIYLSNIYEHVFAYRFFYELRDFCQHGYLLVSQNNGKYCFDLHQLLGMTHIKYKKKYETEVQNIIERIYSDFNDEPNICFTRNIDDYVKCIYEEYYKFLDFINDDIKEKCDTAKEIIKNNPHYIYNQKPLQNMIIYEVEDSNAHMFDSTEDVFKMFINNKNQALTNLKNYDQDYHK